MFEINKKGVFNSSGYFDNPTIILITEPQNKKFANKKKYIEMIVLSIVIIIFIQTSFESTRNTTSPIFEYLHQQIQSTLALGR